MQTGDPVQGMLTMMDDRSLLAAWLDRRDEEAVRLLCERHAPMVRAAAARAASPDPDEAAQAVFIVLLRRAKSVPAEHLAGWLVQTARRIAANQRRGAARRQRHEQEAARVHHDQHTDVQRGESSEADELRPLLDEGLARLSPARREAIVRYHLAGRSQAEVAAELGCSVDAVKTRIHDGLQQLRTFFTRRGHPVGAAGVLAVFAGEAQAAHVAGTTPALSAACAQAALHPIQAGHAATLATTIGTLSMSAKAVLVACCLLALTGGILGGFALRAADAAAPPAPAPAIATTEVKQPPTPVITTPRDPAANAALVWWRAFGLLSSMDPKLWDQPMLRDLPWQNRPEAEKQFSLSRNAALDLFALGSRRDYAAWGVDAGTEGFYALLPYIIDFRKLHNLQCERARWHAFHRRSAAACDDLITALQAARLFAGHKPFIIEWMVGVSCERTAIVSAAAVLPRLEAGDRERLVRALDALPASGTITEALVQDQIGCMGEFGRIRTRIQGLSLTERMRMLQELQNSVAQDRIDAEQNEKTAIQPILDDAALAAGIDWYQAKMSRLIVISRLPPADRFDQMTKGEKHSEMSTGIWTSFAIPSIESLIKADARLMRSHTQLRLAITMSTGDKWENVRDPTTGKFFTITTERTGEGDNVRVSIGLDGKTDESVLYVGGPPPRKKATATPPKAAVKSPVKNASDDF